MEGSVALVTGASRGIGRAIALELARLGATVIVNYSAKPDAAAEVAGECAAVGGGGEAVGFDVADSAAVDAAFDGIKERYGRLDVLVNNAGVTKDGLFVRTRDEDWERTLSVNLGGAFHCSRAAAKLMMKARYGRIVNIGSVVGETGNVGQASYVTAKAGLLGLTKAVARELASRGVTVNAVTPGFIETDMTAGLADQVKAEHLRSVPLGRFGTPEEVAGLVAYLVSKEAAYLTGQVIGVNGGMYM